MVAGARKAVELAAKGDDLRTRLRENMRFFREGLEQWRAYEAWLDPLKAGLGPALEDWRG